MTTARLWMVCEGGTICPYRGTPVWSLFGLVLLMVGISSMTSALAGEVDVHEFSRCNLVSESVVWEVMAWRGDVLPWPTSSSLT